MKSKNIAYLLWFFLGIFSAHRFYLKKYGTAIFYLLTLQLVGIGWIFDLFELGRMVDRYNLKRGYYGPINGLNKSSIVDLNEGNKQPKLSYKEQQIAS
jgi:TM2 domain-containing membrane protein YozV